MQFRNFRTGVAFLIIFLVGIFAVLSINEKSLAQAPMISPMLCEADPSSCISNAIHQPFGALQNCLYRKGWHAWDRWSYNVKAKQNEALYIGDNQNHFTITADRQGYHHTVGRSNNGQNWGVTTIAQLFQQCRWDCTDKIKSALEWFNRSCS